MPVESYELRATTPPLTRHPSNGGELKMHKNAQQKTLKKVYTL
jgi:hypothetical protein